MMVILPRNFRFGPALFSVQLGEDGILEIEIITHED
jgi:hypothetical protein